MAIYSYRKLNDRKDGKHAFLVTVEGGTGLSNLPMWRHADLGQPASLSEARRIFNALESRTIAAINASKDRTRGALGLMSSPFYEEPTRALARDLAEQRAYIVQGSSDLDANDLIGATRQRLMEAGHIMGESEAFGTMHVEEVDGCLALSASGASWKMLMPKFMFSATTNQRGTPDYDQIRLVFDPVTRRHVLGPIDNLDIAESIRRFEAKIADLPEGSPHYSIVNHAREPILKKHPVRLAWAHPFLRTGRKATEVVALAGNAYEVEQSLGASGESRHGSFLLKGPKSGILEVIKNLDNTELEPGYIGPRKRAIDDITESVIEPAVASDVGVVMGASFVNDKEPDQALLDRSAAKAADLLKPGKSLFLPQVETVAFSQMQSQAFLIADDTGSGKTLAGAVSVAMRLAPGEKALVVCPPGLIPQWVRSVDKFFDHLPADTKAAMPPWLQRIQPAAERELLYEKWKRVSGKFVFLPESALQAGIKEHRCKIVTEETNNRSKKYTLQHAAKEAVDEVLAEKIGAMIVDEAQGFRVGGPKYNLLMAIQAGRVKAAAANIKFTVVSTATPMYRSGPSLFPILSLLGNKQARKMPIEAWCKAYCDRKINADGSLAPENGAYGYGMLKEEKIPEITKFLGSMMIARPLEKVAPGKTLARHILTPAPYQPDPELGVVVPGMRQGGAFLPAPASMDPNLRHPIEPYIHHARHKVSHTIEKTKALLQEIPPHEKVVIFTDFHETAKHLQECLNQSGIPAYKLTGKECLNADGKDVGEKTSFVSSINADQNCRAVVLTIGAGGTGLDGLQHSARHAVFNDTMPLAGRVNQAMGRVWRAFDGEPPDKDRPVQIHFQVADCEFDRRNHKRLIDEMHAAQFIREQGLIDMMDSESRVHRLQLEMQKDREKLYEIVGESVPARESLGLQQISPSLQMAIDEVELDEGVSPDPSLLRPPTHADTIATASRMYDRCAAKALPAI